MIEGKRILLVEDNERYRQSLEKALLAAGLEVQTAKDYESALPYVPVALSFRVAVLDNCLPEKDQGRKLAEELNTRNHSLLVISISSGSMGSWPDPNFLADKPFPGLCRYDVNGRTSMRRADLENEYNENKIVSWIQSHEFVLRDEGTVKNLEILASRINS